MPEHARAPRGIPKRPERLVRPLPHRVVLPERGGAEAVAALDLEPLPELVLAVEPLQELLGRLLVFRVLHERVGERHRVRRCPPERTIGDPEVPDVPKHGLALVVLDLLGIALGEDVDRGAVERRADCLLYTSPSP